MLLFITFRYNSWILKSKMFINIVIGPEKWQGICATGKKQSPIDIETEETIIVDSDALKFNRYDLAFQGTLTNTGHSGKEK